MYLASREVPVAAISKVKQTTKAGKATKSPLDPAKVIFLAEQVCCVACENLIYDNPPFETSRMDCIQAKCVIPCDLCCIHYHIPENEFPPSIDDTILPPFIIPAIAMKKRKPRKKPDELKEKELEVVGKAFAVYESQLYAEEQIVASHHYHPRSLYFPKPLQEALAIDLLKIKSHAALNVILALNEWPFIESQGSPLFDLISSLQNEIKLSHKSKSKKAKKVLSDSDSFSDPDVELPATLPIKRAALVAAENQPYAKCQPHQPQQTLAEVESFYARPVPRSY